MYCAIAVGCKKSIPQCLSANYDGKFDFFSDTIQLDPTSTNIMGLISDLKYDDVKCYQVNEVQKRKYNWSCYCPLCEDPVYIFVFESNKNQLNVREMIKKIKVNQHAKQTHLVEPIQKDTRQTQHKHNICEECDKKEIYSAYVFGCKCLYPYCLAIATDCNFDFLENVTEFQYVKDAADKLASTQHDDYSPEEYVGLVVEYVQQINSIVKCYKVLPQYRNAYDREDSCCQRLGQTTPIYVVIYQTCEQIKIDKIVIELGDVIHMA